MGVIGDVFRTIFSPSVQTASSEQTTLTGRDLVSSTTSNDPADAVMGSSSGWKKRNSQGTASLLVPSENLYKGDTK